jgi:hypothetical protein
MQLELGAESDDGAFGDSVAILDDVAASGATLRHAARALAGRGGASIARIAVCAGTRVARATVRGAFPDARWSTFLTGDWRIMHLRDGCAHLPCTGRRLEQGDAADPDDTRVPFRAPAEVVDGSLWQSRQRRTQLA